MTTNTGGPAFPFSPSDDSTIKPQLGMTLRDYFAAKAMQGMLAHAYMQPQTGAAGYARDAYLVADAMLKARGTP